MKTKKMTVVVAMGMCMLCGSNVWAAEIAAPAFTQTTPFVGAEYPRETGGNVWGDYNNDGKPDVFIFGYGTFKLYQGNADDTTFTDVTDAVFGASHPSQLWRGSAAWLDYNKDGNLDLIVAGNDGSNDSTTVYTNGGEASSYALTVSGITLPAVQSGEEHATGRFIAVADYDGDTYPDVLITGKNSGNSIFSLYKNNGDGTGFTYQNAAYNNGEFPIYSNSAIAWGDFDNNGKPDILFNGHGNGDPDGVAGVYKNNGDGTFSEILLSKGAYKGEVAWIDYNKDGKQDILITGQYWASGDWHYWNTFLFGNNGDETFTEVPNHDLGGTCESFVAVGDINKDTYEDVVLMGQYEGQGVFYNNGDGTFSKTNTLIISGISKGMISLVDLGGDNDLDMIITGNYIAPTLYQNKYPEGAGIVVIPPFPEPADVDLVEFTPVEKPVGGTAAFPVNLTQGGAAWGDYDDDGNLDVLIWGYYEGTSATLTNLYKNNGNGTFTDKSAEILGSSFPKIAKGAAAWLDYNNDGYLDLIVSGATKVDDDVAENQTTVTKIYTNEGPIVGYLLNTTPSTDNIFQSFDYEKKGGISRNIAVTDYNNDGWQDVLFCSRYTDVDAGGTERHFEIYKNKAGTTFELQPNANTGLVNGNGGGVAWGDYNNDGFQDILFSSYRDDVEGGYRSGVFTNKGDGTFTETLFYTNGADFGLAEELKSFGTETGEVIWVDVNADGYLDAIVTGSGNTYGFNGDLHVYNPISWQWWTTTVFLYDPDAKTFGTGRPNEMGTRIGGTCEGGITWADLNDDGLPDVITSGQHEGSSISYNTSNGVFNRQSFGKNFQQGGITVVDYDKDGKLDIFATGQEGALLLQNTSNITPVAPAAPAGFTATSGADGELTLSWAASTDDPTVRYNVFAKKAISAYSNLVISLVPVDVATGQLKVSYDHLPLLSTNSYALKGIAGGDYTVGVQAVGANGKTSAFTPATVTVGGSGSTGVEKALAGAFSAYKSGEAIVVTTDVAQAAELAVYSFTGAKLWSKTGVFTGATQITGLQQGTVYLVVLRVGDAQAVKKVTL